MMSACCLAPRLVRERDSSASCNRLISSRERKRVSTAVRLSFTPRAGLVSMCPQAIARLRIWRWILSAWFAPPGAVRL